MPRYRLVPSVNHHTGQCRGWLVVDRQQRTYNWSPRIVVPLTTYARAYAAFVTLIREGLS